MMSLSGRLRRVANMISATLAGTPMITCEQALASMHELIDGELGPEDRERVRSHFEVCGRCYPRLRVEKSFRAAVRASLQGESAPPHLVARVRILLNDVAQG